VKRPRTKSACLRNRRKRRAPPEGAPSASQLDFIRPNHAEPSRFEALKTCADRLAKYRKAAIPMIAMLQLLKPGHVGDLDVGLDHQSVLSSQVARDARAYAAIAHSGGPVGQRCRARPRSVFVCSCHPSAFGSHRAAAWCTGLLATFPLASVIPLVEGEKRPPLSRLPGDAPRHALIAWRGSNAAGHERREQQARGEPPKKLRAH
jgi:hypothetical protein